MGIQTDGGITNGLVPRAFALGGSRAGPWPPPFPGLLPAGNGHEVSTCHQGLWVLNALRMLLPMHQRNIPSDRAREGEPVSGNGSSAIEPLSVHHGSDLTLRTLVRAQLLSL